MKVKSKQTGKKLKKSMHQRFKNWCRLCAKQEGCTKDVLDQRDSSAELLSTIERHFSLQIEADEKAPTTICDECYEFLVKLIEFEDLVLRSQLAFKGLEGSGDESCDVKAESPGFYSELEDKFDPPEAVLDVEFSCSQCEQSFPTDTELRRHIKAHSSSKLVCDICGTEFGKSFSLRNHKKLVHSNVRPFVCDECGTAFKRAGDLTRHKEFHRDDTPFACRICDKKFKSKLVVKMHEKNHEVQSYMCNICGQELKNKYTLRGHMKTHSADMQFQCKYCVKKFRYKKNLNCHLLTHTGVQPYVCAFCNQAFSLRWNCRTHQKKIHPAELAEFEMEGKPTVVTNLVKQKFACGRRHKAEKAASSPITA